MAGFGMKSKQPEKKISVGLDIGSSFVKVVELSTEAGNSVISACGSSRVSGLSRQEASSSIEELFTSLKISSKEVNISVSGPALIVRFIQMPRMDRESLKGAIRFEAEKFIPFDISDCVIDFQVTSESDKDKKQNILFVAVKKDFIKEKIKIAEGAGLSVNIIDVDNFALANSFIRNIAAADPGKSRAVINMGAVNTNICIIRDGAVHFVRDISTGSNDVTLAIAKKLGIDKSAAEDMKISPKGKIDEIADCVKAVLGTMLDETKLSFGYYENQFGRSVDEIYVSGGGSGAVGLVSVFKDVFGTDPVIWDPFSFLGSASAVVGQGVSGQNKNMFAVAVGLALR